MAVHAQPADRPGLEAAPPAPPKAPARSESDLEQAQKAPLLQHRTGLKSYLGEASGDLPDAHRDHLILSEKGHQQFLDLTRVACVLCVAVDHGNSLFGEWNVMFTQEWVLQYLYLVCGVCYGMSRKSLLEYELRLAKYFVLGVGINWAAWIAAGLDWQKNFFDVVFHLWFVVGVMLYACILWPLKLYLEHVSRRRGSPLATSDGAGQAFRDSILGWVAVLGGGVSTLYVLFKVVMVPAIKLLAPVCWRLWEPLGDGAAFWGLPTSPAETEEFISSVCTSMLLTTSNVFLILVCPLVFQQTGHTTWAVLANTTIQRCVLYRSQLERPFHGLDLMTLALTCYYLGLSHRRRAGDCLVRYWFLFVLACLLLWPIGCHTRFDMAPPVDDILRARVNLLEQLFVVAWLVAAERLVHPDIVTKDGLRCLNVWALIVFLVHQAIHMLVRPPFNWAAILAIAPACYYGSCCTA